MINKFNLHSGELVTTIYRGRKSRRVQTAHESISVNDPSSTLILSSSTTIRFKELPRTKLTSYKLPAAIRFYYNGSLTIYPSRSGGRRHCNWYAQLTFPPLQFHISLQARAVFPEMTLCTDCETCTAQCSGPLTINSQTDADALQSCTKYTGSITISDQASGTIALNGVEQLTGDLKINNATQLSSLTADQLNSIGGTWNMQDMTILSNLAFDSLTSVDQIYWVGLPALQGLSFAQGIQKASNVLISNTQLYTSSGIELQTVEILNINNNPYLSSVNVNNLKNVTSQLTFAANAMNLQISFPNLVGGANMTFRNVSSVDMPSLSTVAGNMGFYSDNLQSFSAPNLTSTTGSLAFADCPQLSNTSFPSLTQIGGGFQLANNTNLKAISGFPALKVVIGAIDFAGTFSR